MIDDDSQLKDEVSVPAELQQTLPRRIRLAVRGRSIYYFVGSIVVSIAIATLAMIAGSLTPKEIRERNALRREGNVTHTNDVRVGGMRSATVFYTFTYNGQSYSGNAFLPHEYLEKVENYSKTGKFPVLFLPRNPSINHPNDWTGSGSVPLILYLLLIIIIFQWIFLSRFILHDLRLARNGVAALGLVTDCSYGRNGGIYLKYEFRDMDDLLTKGRGEYPVRKQQGTKICILYLPDESEKSRPYPLVFFRAVE